MPKYDTFPVRAKNVTDNKPDYDEIRLLEHETHPDVDYRIEHDTTYDIPCKYCAAWIRNFTENLPDPLYEPNAQTGKMPWDN